MFNYQEVRIAGNLGADPEVRCKPNSDNGFIVNLRVGVTESWKDKSTGEWNDRTEWFRVVKFNLSEKAADYFSDKLRKGTNVFVAGQLRTRKWDDNGEVKYITELVADRIEKIQDSGKTDNADQARSGGRSSGKPSQSSQDNTSDDPFGDDVGF